jgi:hypothetical protein
LHSLQRQNKIALFPEATENYTRQLYLTKTDDDITCAIESFAVQQAAWSAMPTSNNPDINIEYSCAIQEKLTEKRRQAMAN